jgi:hypothetical protein
VEGWNVVAPNLNIDADGTAEKIELGNDQYFAYYASNDNKVANGGLSANGGFSDLVAQGQFKAHHYTFTFAPGVSVTNFSLPMLDYGDWNYEQITDHHVSMTAYNANGDVVDQQVLTFTTPTDAAPRSSTPYGDLYLHGDAVTAGEGQPGNWYWNVSGNGITRVVLSFKTGIDTGYDPYIGFDKLTYTYVCQ